MRYLKFLSAIVLSGLLLAGCASVAHVEKDDSANFSNYHSYTWVETQDSKNDSAKARVSDLTERKIKEAVNAELSKTGWRETKHKPDVLLSYDVLIERSIEQKNDPVYTQPFTRMYYNPYARRWGTIYYPSQFIGYQTYEVPTKEGTITITMTDANTDKVVWQAWTTERLNYSQLTTDEISKSVRNIFNKFDVAAR